jgi:D-glycero-alpha-D-manno-heptose-7-phosphate kinase
MSVEDLLNGGAEIVRSRAPLRLGLAGGGTDLNQYGGAKIVRSRVPLRLGLAGGGTDLSPYCDEHGGAVLNTTIDRYAYAIIAPSPDDHVHLVAPDLGVEEIIPADHAALADAKLLLHAGVLCRMSRQFDGGRIRPLRVTSFVDAPPGSGLGSSSALCVALVEAFRAEMHLPLGPYDVAHLAFEIERIELGLAGGKQDQYSATFGGTNFIEFLAGDRVIVNPLRVGPAVLNELEIRLVICFTGVSRRSERIIEEQTRNMTEHSADALAGLHRLKCDAQDMKDALLRGQIDRISEILNGSWLAKKRTAHGVSSERIDTLMRIAFAAGATGGKVSGAGGGGFMMLLVPPERRVSLIHALNEAGGMASGVHLTGTGAESWMI